MTRTAHQSTRRSPRRPATASLTRQETVMRREDTGGRYTTSRVQNRRSTSSLSWPRALARRARTRSGRIWTTESKVSSTGQRTQPPPLRQPEAETLSCINSSPDTLRSDTFSLRSPGCSSPFIVTPPSRGIVPKPSPVRVRHVPEPTSIGLARVTKPAPQHISPHRAEPRKVPSLPAR